ncbi:MAG TPA: PhnD/SsuA/transferrin family substrate-binding protein, partial [Opitutus sp.]|nr:PhnD/SsuA/transferrin family substrate-binding protein [Opitutus sp.]
VEAVAAAVRNKEVNYVGLTTEEFAALDREVAFDRFTAAVVNGDKTETYLLLAHRASDLRSLADLRGKQLTLSPGPRLSLAPVWLDVELTRQGFPTAAEFFSRQVEFPKPAKAVLAVFFRQADACLTTRRLFDTMVELNPQVGQELRIVAASPGYVPSLFAFIADFPAELKEKSMREFSTMHLTPSGQQILTIFQTSETTELFRHELEPSLALVNEHARLCPAANAARRAALRRPRTLDTSAHLP